MRISKSATFWTGKAATLFLAVLFVVAMGNRAWSADGYDSGTLTSQAFASDSAPANPQPLQPLPSSTPAPGTIGPGGTGLGVTGSSAGSLGDWRALDSSEAAELWREWPDRPKDSPIWSVQYQFRSFFNSKTSKEFGTPFDSPDGWTPLSELNFPLNSNWHGAEVRVRQLTWELHCEYMVPQQGIRGDLKDKDWQVADEPFTDLGFASERWVDGQTLDFGLDFQLLDRPFDLPCEVWPTLGFRWQRFDMMCYDAVQVKQDGVWLDPPDEYPGDVIRFNQQYYVFYLGGQIRGRIDLKRLPPIAWKFQGDWGDVNAFNVDYHLLREPGRRSSEKTHGGLYHLGITAEMPLYRRLSVGVQADYTKLRTQGEHHLYVPTEGINEAWTNGVVVSSEQTALTVFFKLSM